MKTEVVKTIVFISFCITIILLGAGNHFWYEQSGNTNGIKWFAAINESTYEHIKLIVWPWILCTLILIVLYKSKVKGLEFYKNHSSSMVGLYSAMGLIPALFYLYTEGFGIEHNLTADIIIFVLAVIIGIIVWGLFIECNISIGYDYFIFLVLLLAVIIWVFSCAYSPNGCMNIYDEPHSSHSN